jgi:hypothetical protein
MPNATLASVLQRNRELEDKCRYLEEHLYRMRHELDEIKRYYEVSSVSGRYGMDYARKAFDDKFVPRFPDEFAPMQEDVAAMLKQRKEEEEKKAEEERKEKLKKALSARLKKLL